MQLHKKDKLVTTALPVMLAAVVVLSSSLVGGRPASAATGLRSGEQPRESIQVSGTGEVFGEPDTLTADFAVETSASTVDAALTRATTAATRMRDALLKGGLVKADLRTSNVGINAKLDDKGKTTGYAVNQGLTATIRTVPKAGALISAAVAAGGDAARVNGVSFAIENSAALLAEARRKAFADARAKADLYALAAGRPLGRVVAVTETTTPGDEGSGLRHYQGAADSAVPIEPGRRRLAVTVTVAWALQTAGRG